MARRPSLFHKCVVAALVSLPVVGLGQTLVPKHALTFQAGVEVIRLSLSVTDSEDRLVTGLAEDDFAVFEDGVRQNLSFFAQEPAPLSVSLLIDSSSSMRDKLKVAQAAGSRFVAALRPEDVGQVAQINERLTVLEDFTSDQAALQAALRSTQAAGSTALHNALYVILRELRHQGSLEAPRRRAIVLLSDGEDTTSLVDEDRVLELARQADVAVYAIALLGAARQDRERRASREGVHFLRVLARESGGEAYFPSSLSQLSAIYERVAGELRNQYMVGYVPRGDRRDGRFHRIEVRTPSRAHLQVRHRLGYYSSRG
jgi:Ca-activated chloride channel family protein